MKRTRAYESTKRGIDVVVAAVVLLVTAPIQAVVALLVRRDLGSPVIFRQQRPGLHAEPFELRKFRTMRPGIEGYAAHDADRLTPLGSWLRRTSIDELPTMWNVLRGDMSLVGPRPLLPRYVALYDDHQRRRHEVRPGVTGLAQVSGRNAVDWPTRFALDVDYVDRRSTLLDLQIMARTVALVLRRRGVTDGESATMSDFTGGAAQADSGRSRAE